MSTTEKKWLSKLIPEDVMVQHNQAINKMAITVLEQKKTLVLVSIIPYDLKKMDVDRITPLVEDVSASYRKQIGHDKFEVLLRSYGLTEAETQKWDLD